MKERWPEMLEYQQKVQAMTDLERFGWVKELLLSWMQTRPGGVYQSSIQATEFQRLVKMLTFNVQEACAVGRREMRDACLIAIAEQRCERGTPWDMALQAALAAVRALPLTPEADGDLNPASCQQGMPCGDTDNCPDPVGCGFERRR